MGKWKAGTEQKQAGWGYWSGSWSAWKPPSSAAASSTIPAYDAQKPKFEAQPQPGPQLKSPQDSEAGLVQGLQKAVNSARKAEGRVKRIHAERLEHQQQWAAWEQELRRTFAKERARYTAALTRLEGEMKDAMKQQAEARQVLRQVATGEVHREMVEPQDMATEEFDALMSGAPDPWDAEASQDAVLRRALQETFIPNMDAPSASTTARPTLTTPQRPTTLNPMTPNLHAPHGQPRLGKGNQAGAATSTRMMPFPPPLANQQILLAADGASPKQATVDPYSAVVETAHGASATRTVAGVLTSPVNGPPKTPKVRQGIKEGSRPTKPVHMERFPGFQETVDAKRASLMAELGANIQQFVIHDDEDTGQGDPQRSGPQQEMD